MPRVPAAPQTVVTESVGSRPLQIPKIPTVAVDVDPLARGFFNAAQIKQRSDLQLQQIRLSEAETQTIARWNARLYNDKDAYYKKGGKDAVESLEPSYKELQDIQNEIADGLESGADRRLYNQAMAQRHQQHRVKMGMKSFDERQVWDKNTAFGNISAQIESATNDTSPENLSIAEARIIDESAAVSKIDSLPPEAAQIKADALVSSMYTAAIGTEIAKDQPHLAQEMLERYSDKIGAKEEAILRNRLNEITVAAESRGLAMEAMASSDNPTEQLAHVQKQFGSNPTPRQLEVIERARQKVTNTRNQIETAEGVAEGDNYDTLAKAVIDRTNRGERGIGIIEDLTRQFPERFEDDVLSGGHRAALNRLVQTGSANETTEEGYTNYAKIMELAATNPAVLAELDPMDYVGQMSSSHWEKAQKAINDAKGSGITSDTSSLGSRQKTLNEKARNQGFDLTTGDKKPKPEAIRIQKESMERLDEFIAAQKRQPTEKEWNEIIDGLFVKVLLDDAREPLPFPYSLFRGDVEATPAFALDIQDAPPLQREATRQLFINQFGREPLPNELETHFIELMNNPKTRQILTGQ